MKDMVLELLTELKTRLMGIHFYSSKFEEETGVILKKIQEDEKQLLKTMVQVSSSQGRQETVLQQ